jgi:hypothetical protein
MNRVGALYYRSARCERVRNITVQRFVYIYIYITVQRFVYIYIYISVPATAVVDSIWCVDCV